MHTPGVYPLSSATSLWSSQLQPIRILLLTMVSADNLNFDCLEIIFTYLSGNDLVSVSLVSRSFLAAAIPRIYRTLAFGLNQAKRYPTVRLPNKCRISAPA